ncbi:MAG: hypothetical protein HYY01_05390 [Chloroflexi bacterium]|nr:hypothetical protein [Chloroflexota bacterium]
MHRRALVVALLAFLMLFLPQAGLAATHPTPSYEFDLSWGGHFDMNKTVTYSNDTSSSVYISQIEGWIDNHNDSTTLYCQRSQVVGWTSSRSETKNSHIYAGGSWNQVFSAISGMYTKDSGSGTPVQTATGTYITGACFPMAGWRVDFWPDLSITHDTFW